MHMQHQPAIKVAELENIMENNNWPCDPWQESLVTTPAALYKLPGRRVNPKKINKKKKKERLLFTLTSINFS